MAYVVIITGADGTLSACGTFPSEYEATLFANQVETEESGLLSTVTQLEAPASVAAELGIGGAL